MLLNKFQGIKVNTTCQNTVDFGSSTLHSSNYPSNYELMENCSWHIEGTVGRQIQISFRDFETEPNNDTLYIYDGPDKNSPIVGLFNGPSTPNDMVSRGNSLLLEFVSDGETNLHGFEIDFFVKGKI